MNVGNASGDSVRISLGSIKRIFAHLTHFFPMRYKKITESIVGCRLNSVKNT